MVCLAWWVLVVLLIAAAALGFALHFAWTWWLLSRPDFRGR
jgi:hypothetical protein